MPNLTGPIWRSSARPNPWNSPSSRRPAPAEIGTPETETKGQTHDQPVSDARVGRKSRPRLHFGTHYVCFIFRRGCDHAPLRIDDRGNAVVGGANHRPSG